MIPEPDAVPELEPLGDRAWVARFATDREAAGWASAVREAGWPGVLDASAAFRAAAVFADPDRADLDDLERRLRGLPVPGGEAVVGRLAEVPVLYDGEDLAEIAGRTGLDGCEVIALHAGRAYPVAAVGFLPGFPYLSGLPGPLAGVPRRPTPRPRVPAGSVAIAAGMSCVYPAESPGGWHVIGRTPLRIADPRAGHFPLRAGDRVRFEAIDPGRFAELEGRMLLGR